MQQAANTSNWGGSRDLDLGLVGSAIKIKPCDADAGGDGGAHSTPEKEDGAADEPASPAPILSAAPVSRSMLKREEAKDAPPRLDHSDEGLMVRCLLRPVCSPHAPLSLTAIHCLVASLVCLKVGPDESL